MYLIAGLGNPGDKYTLTRHNIGFLIIDEIIRNQNVSTINNKNFQSLTFKYNSNIYAKPQTFMNNSGVAIKNIADYYDIPNENIIIIHDDLDLQFGAIKFKKGGGHGGHNGLRSIDSHIGQDYIRVRVGIGKPKQKEDIVHYVLSNFSKEQLEHMNNEFSHIIKAIETLQQSSLTEVKSLFSKKGIEL
jgi:peptidyl-tRNA hydrolase, PTH1 family